MNPLHIAPPRRRPNRTWWVALLLITAGCGGGGGSESSAATTGGSLAITSPAITPVGAADTGNTLAVAVDASTFVAANTPEPAIADVPVVVTTAAAPALPVAPTLPRAGLGAQDLALLVAEGDAQGEAIARAYQLVRGIPDAQVIRLPVPTGSDVIGDSAFATLKAQLDARLPATVQATLVTWTQPSRVQGSSCSMGITSALAFGYNAMLCGGCNRTQASAYFDTDTTRPYSDLRIRPSMMLGAATLEAAQALIARGLAAEGSAPSGTGWLLRTADAARSVRHTDFQALPDAWRTEPVLDLRYVDASTAGSAQEVVQQSDLLFYFTGLAKLQQLGSNRFLPGAVADHLTSFGGLLPEARGQMPATAWLAAGATASYGTVEEPCNHVEKFPRASVLIDHYLRGATVIEAYWKSVAWPGQGLFVGDPLARPWANEPSAAIEDGALVVRSRALRRNGAYRVDWLAAGSSQWRTLDSLTAGQPRPVTWRVPLPAVAAGGRLRWVGPCPLQPAQSCVLSGG
ncbi:MAG: hypothetical protein A3E25_07525 [Burkholderiales bacterium RIFCSPHIGHO2_12_FULL_69_20]|nr:MAG: hypothetical protein A3E25_07525 [Burkholderiales bacterium RIFCSPHIGHO2_12_FULL_69_20]